MAPRFTVASGRLVGGLSGSFGVGRQKLIADSYPLALALFNFSSTSTGTHRFPFDPVPSRTFGFTAP